MKREIRENGQPVSEKRESILQNGVNGLRNYLRSWEESARGWEIRWGGVWLAGGFIAGILFLLEKFTR